MSHLKQINKIDTTSCGKVLGILYACMGGIIGIVMFIMFLITGTSNSQIQPVFIFIGATLTILCLALIYGFFGWITGAFSAYLYNFIAKKFGGIKIDIK